ncbi:sugar transferase [uncultured Desulfobulbus sp.]|uniref:sugar transferase n=1 Tax=uncultured Desulfobulbus sp. TaxID=239745 RepID=UPI0029C7C4AE|nr:sugar transferase [uncultured Desulfobulbus sp.]
MHKTSKKLYLIIKAIIDFVMAVILLIILGIPMLLIALMIRLDSRGPVIYRQLRVGVNEKPFTIYKFRTMKIDAPVLPTEEIQKLEIDPYTKLGPILRKGSFDELPQFFNVIKGEMSFVGPRPALPTQTDVNDLRKQCDVEWLKPGITGWAQINGRDDISVETKVRLDAEYAKKVSFLFDFIIVIRTFTTIFTAKGNK